MLFLQPCSVISRRDCRLALEFCGLLLSPMSDCSLWLNPAKVRLVSLVLLQPVSSLGSPLAQFSCVVYFCLSSESGETKSCVLSHLLQKCHNILCLCPSSVFLLREQSHIMPSLSLASCIGLEENWKAIYFLTLHMHFGLSWVAMTLQFVSGALWKAFMETQFSSVTVSTEKGALGLPILPNYWHFTIHNIYILMK